MIFSCNGRSDHSHDHHDAVLRTAADYGRTGHNSHGPGLRVSAAGDECYKTLELFQERF